MNSDHMRGLVMVTVGVLVLSPDALIIRLVEADQWTLLWWRGLLTAIGLAAYLIFRNGREAGAKVLAIGRLGMLSTPLFAGSTILFVTSVTLTTAANTLVIVSAAPLFAAVFSHLFLGEVVPLRTWFAVVAGVTGIAVIFADSLGAGSLWGDLCAVGTAAFLAGHLVVARHARPVSMVPAVAISGLLVTAVVAPLAAPFAITSQDFVLLLVLGLVIMPISFGLITAGPRYLPAAEVSLIMLLEAVFGPLWVWLAVGEVPASATFLGGAVVLATLIIHAVLGLRRVPPGSQSRHG
jgi:drug/metabolite transporter (DMT)-like permease